MKLITILSILLIPALAIGADVTLRWDVSVGATSYKVYQSVDSGTAWTEISDAGDVQLYTVVGVPDSGLVLFRVSAYKGQDEAIRYWSGAWYNGDWLPVGSPGSAGIE